MSTPPFANAMSSNSAALWSDFLRCFLAELSATPKTDLKWAWQSADNRTKFYRDCMLPKVGTAMGLTARYELFRVDSSFCVQHPGPVWVPIVQVESENSAGSAAHEVAKLCALVGPLKVLITCDQWAVHGGWEHGGNEQRRLTDWRAVIAAYRYHYPANGIIGLIVGEHDSHCRLRFYATELSGVTPCGAPLFEVDLSNTAPLNPNCPDRLAGVIKRGAIAAE